MENRSTYVACQASGTSAENSTPDYPRRRTMSPAAAPNVSCPTLDCIDSGLHARTNTSSHKTPNHPSILSIAFPPLERCQGTDRPHLSPPRKNVTIITASPGLPSAVTLNNAHPSSTEKSHHEQHNFASVPMNPDALIRHRCPRDRSTQRLYAPLELKPPFGRPEDTCITFLPKTETSRTSCRKHHGRKTPVSRKKTHTATSREKRAHAQPLYSSRCTPDLRHQYPCLTLGSLPSIRARIPATCWIFRTRVGRSKKFSNPLGSIASNSTKLVVVNQPSMTTGPKLQFSQLLSNGDRAGRATRAGRGASPALHKHSTRFKGTQGISNL